MNVDQLEWQTKGCCGEYQVAVVGDLHITKAGEEFRVLRMEGNRMREDLGLISREALEVLT